MIQRKEFLKKLKEREEFTQVNTMEEISEY
jgi:hypothetical protein